MKQFEVGKRYGMNSICDSDCWWYYTVIERTACTITLKSDRGEIIKCRMNSKRNEIYGCEAVRPLGSYSMCPTLTAEKEIQPEKKLREEVRKEGTTPDGRNVKVVERYDEMAVNQGCFLIVDGEETEYAFLGTAITMFNDLVRPVKQEKPADGVIMIGGVKVCEFRHFDITEEEPKAVIVPMNAKPSYQEMVSICEGIAKEYHTMFETHDYSEYGWASLSFMTDKFGGTYVHIHYDHKTGEMVNWFGHKNARKVENVEQLRMMVKYCMKKELKARDMHALSEFINSQY